MAALATRIAARELGSHRGRTLLIGSLLAVPLAVMAALATSANLPAMNTPDSIANGAVGSAPAELVGLRGANGTCTQAQLAAPECRDASGETLPQTLETPPLESITLPNTHPRPVAGVTVPMKWRQATLDADVLVQDVLAPEESARHAVDPHRAPTADEVLITGAAMNRLSLRVGDTVTLAERDYRIAGRLRSVGSTGFVGEPSFAVPPGHPLAAGAKVDAVLLDRVPTDAERVDLNHRGVAVVSRQALIDLQAEHDGSASDNAVMGAFIVAGTMLALMVTGTVAAAAFAIGFRQQRRSLALLTATGAPPGMIQSISLRQGALIGAIACGLGVVVGAAAGMGIPWRMRDLSPEYPRPVTAPVITLVALFAVGVGAAVLSAWIPARQVALHEVVEAVRSSETAQQPARRPYLGFAVIALGLLIGIVGTLPVAMSNPGFRKVEKGIIPAVISVVVLFFGAVLSMGWLLERLSGLGARGSVAMRLASRDWARNRSRASSVVIATMAVTALAGTVLVTNASVGRTSVADWVQQDPAGFVIVTNTAQSASLDGQVVSQITAVMGAPRAARALSLPAQGDADFLFPVLSLEPRCDQSGTCTNSAEVVVDDGGLVEFLTGTPATAQQRDMLAQGGALAPAAHVSNHQVTIQGEKSATVAAIAYGDPTMPAIVGPTFVAKHGFKAPMTTTQVWLDYGRRPTPEEGKRIEQLVLEFGAGQSNARWDAGPVDAYAAVTPWFALVFGSVMVIVSVIATTLALRDARRTSEVLAVAGASSWTLRKVTATSAVVTTAVGVVAGLLVGAIPVVLVILGTRGYVLLAIPWLYLVPLVVAVPLLLGVVGWLVPSAKARAVRAD